MCSKEKVLALSVMHPKAGQHAYFSLLLVWIFWFFYNCCLNIPKQISASNSSIGLAKAGRRDWRKGKRKREKKEGCSGFLDLLPEVAECTRRIGKARGSPSESLKGGWLLKLPSLRDRWERQQVLLEVWDGVKPLWENLLLPSEFQAPPWIMSVFHVLKGPRHWRSKQSSTGSYLEKGEIWWMLCGVFPNFQIQNLLLHKLFTNWQALEHAFYSSLPQTFQICLCLKFPAVCFKIGSTYRGAHDGSEWGTMLPVSIWSSDLVVSSEKWLSSRQEGLFSHLGYHR